MDDFTEGGRARPFAGAPGQVADSSEVSLLKSEAVDSEAAAIVSEIATEVQRYEEIELDQMIRNLPWVKNCGLQPYKVVLENCWHEFNIKNWYFDAVYGDSTLGRLRGAKGRNASTPTQLFTKGVAALLLPSVPEQKSELPDRPSTLLAEESVVEIVKAFYKHAKLMADALVWAENLIVLYGKDVELYSGIWTCSSSTQRNIDIAKGLTRRLLDGELPKFSLSDETVRRKALINILEEKTGITTISQVREKLTDVASSLEKIVEDEWSEFTEKDHDLTGFEDFLRKLLSCGSIISTASEDSKWREKYHSLVAKETNGQGELSIWIAKQALTTNSGLVDPDAPSSLTARPRVRKTAGRRHGVERSPGRVVPPLGLSLEERFTEHFKSRDVGERIKTEDLPKLLTDEAHRTSTWAGLSHVDSRLCLAVSIRVGKELYGFVDAMLTQTEHPDMRAGFRNSPALTTTRAIAAHFLSVNLMKNHFIHGVQEKNLHSLEDGEILQAMRQRRAVASKILGERLENLEAIVPNRVWKQTHLQEVYGVPIGQGDNLGRIIGADAHNLVRKLSSEWAKNAARPIDQRHQRAVDQMPANHASEYSADELIMYLGTSMIELQGDPDVGDCLMMSLRSDLMKAIVGRGDDLSGETPETGAQTRTDTDADWHATWNEILRRADQEKDELSDYMRRTSPDQVDRWLKKNWSN